MSTASPFRSVAFRALQLSLLLATAQAVVAATPPVRTTPKVLNPDAVLRANQTIRTPAATPAAGGLRILLVDDDYSDNNNIPGDRRQSPSDVVFRKLAADAVGGDAKSWAIEVVASNKNGPAIDKLRPYSLVLWYTGSSYGGNPDNTAVLSLEDEKSIQQYLKETGGAVVLFSPGYASKVLEQGSTWEKASWPFLNEVMGVRGGQGLAQRFEAGIVTTSQGTQFHVGKGSATVESQFSAVNPEGAEVVFTADLPALRNTGKPAPVATAFSYGKGRIVYVGFTFENLAAAELAGAFQQLLVSAGAASNAAVASVPAPQTNAVSSPAAEPATVQVSGTPTTALVSWTLQPVTDLNARLTRPELLASGASTAQAPTTRVERLVPNAAPVRLALATADALQAKDPGPLTPGQAVTYRVTLTDSAGAIGFKDVSFTPPPPKDPTGLTATTAADGSVTLTWQAVSDAVGYQITGTTLTTPVTVSYTTQWTSPPQAPGMQQWKVASLYEPGRVLTAASAWPSVNSRRVPNPGMPYLLLPNGAGSIAESTAAYDQQCIATPEGGPQEFACPGATYFLSQATNWLRTWNSFYGGGAVAPTWPIAAFADLNDLGRGRRANCTPIGTATARGTLCWATTHGVVPPPGQSPNGTALATAAEQMADIKSLNIIITTAQGSFFGAWGPGVARPNSGGRNPEDAFTETSNKLYLTALDNQGLKAVPHACLSCHGGRYDPARKLVVGASLLPLIPSHLNFSSPAARASAEEQIRRINTIILDSAPAPAITAQITVLYNGTPGTPGTVANDAAVPAGWAAQPGLYRQVIAPYCGTCHFAQTGPLNFASYNNLVMNKDRVQRAVCVAFTMPHSEQGLRRFWTEGGPVFLPGLLSTVLGYPKCPQ